MDELKQQIQALKELVEIQRQTIETLKLNPKTVYQPYYIYQPYYHYQQYPYQYGASGLGSSDTQGGATMAGSTQQAVSAWQVK